MGRKRKKLSPGIRANLPPSLRAMLDREQEMTTHIRTAIWYYYHNLTAEQRENARYSLDAWLDKQEAELGTPAGNVH